MDPQPRVRLWGTISGLLVFGLAFTVWPTLAKMETVYLQMELRELPAATEAALVFGPFLWIPAAAGWVIAAVRARKNRVEAASWFFQLTIAIVVVDVLALLAILYPLTIPRP